MARFIIKGGSPVGGVVRPIGNKNAALPMLAACVLTDESITLKRVPDIDDVRVMLQLLEAMGVSVDRRGSRLTLNAARLHASELAPDLCRKVRSSILFAGPLTARTGRTVLHPPGGDIIGRRRLDTHHQGLSALGMDITLGESFSFSADGLRGADILLDEASVTATENIMMAAVLARGKTVIENAACEPHVVDLGTLLTKMGARIDGLGTNRITIQGRRRLRGADHTIGPDIIEVGGLLAAAAATGAPLTVRNAGPRRPYRVLARSFQKLGVQWQWRGQHLLLPAGQTPRVQADLHSMIPKIEDGTWPAFPSDLMSVTIVLASQAHGTVLFFEKLFESRLHFVDQLISMGAAIVQCDPHRVLVTGPASLRGAHMATPDIRAGMALMIAALCANGASIIENAHIVDRGYERITDRLAALGADIVREEP